MKEAKPNLCIDCPGHCCSRNLINLCGYDAWVIARRLYIKPTDFLAFADLQGQDTPYNFQLDGSGKSYHMALNMNEGADGSRRCIFGLYLPHGQFRCGIYALRPVGCRSYPFVLERGELAIKPRALCPEGVWALDDDDVRSLKAQLGQSDMEFCIYGLLVASWNEQVAQKPPLETLDFHPFVNFVMDVYDRLNAARAQVPANAWLDIWNRWQECIVNGVNPLGSNGMRLDQPCAWDQWLQNIHRAVEDAISIRFAQERMTEFCCV